MDDTPIFWIVRRWVGWRAYAVYSESPKTFKAKDLEVNWTQRTKKKYGDVRLRTEAAATALRDELNMHEKRRDNEMRRALDPISAEYDRRVAEAIAKHTDNIDG